MPTFDLKFHPASDKPTEPGDYLLYNQCDGYHVAKAWFGDNGEFVGFWFFAASRPIPEDFYCAWALLPDGVKTMYDAFAKKEHVQITAPQQIRREVSDAY